MSQVIIKRLNKRKDILYVFSLFSDRFLSLQRGEDFCEALARKYEDNAEFFALYYDGEPAAFSAFYCNDNTNNTAFISLIGVLQRFEGNGFGGIMLDKAIEISREHGMKTMTLEVKKSNERAVSMYRKKGFEITGQKDDIMLIMSKSI